MECPCLFLRLFTVSPLKEKKTKMGKRGPKFMPNRYAHLTDGTVIVLLKLRDGVMLGFIDAADWERVRGHRWYAVKDHHTFYAVTNIRKADGRKTIVRMHRLLLPDANTEEIDHEDHDGLNNRRKNIRAATRSQNNANRKLVKQKPTSSKYRGVSWNRQRNKWCAGIKVNGKNMNLGGFTSEVDAARAYDVAAVQYFGQFARLNFLALEEVA